MLLSFHGLPKRYAAEGDPYPTHCEATAAALRFALGDVAPSIDVVYQSRFGREEWLQPYTDITLGELGRRGERVAVMCPGFTADCLETLEEIGIRGLEQFHETGGKTYLRVPCVNEHPVWMAAMRSIAARELAGWITHSVLAKTRIFAHFENRPIAHCSKPTPPEVRFMGRRRVTPVLWDSPCDADSSSRLWPRLWPCCSWCGLRAALVAEAGSKERSRHPRHGSRRRSRPRPALTSPSADNARSAPQGRCRGGSRDHRHGAATRGAEHEHLGRHPMMAKAGIARARPWRSAD